MSAAEKGPNINDPALAQKKRAFVRTAAEGNPALKSLALQAMVREEFKSGIDPGSLCAILKAVRIEKGHPLPRQSREAPAGQKTLNLFEKSGRAKVYDLRKVTALAPVANCARPGLQVACIMECGHCVVLPASQAKRGDGLRGRRCAICAKAMANKPAETLAKKLIGLDRKLLLAALELLAKEDE